MKIARVDFLYPGTEHGKCDGRYYCLGFRLLQVLLPNPKYFATTLNPKYLDLYSGLEQLLLSSASEGSQLGKQRLYG